MEPFKKALMFIGYEMYYKGRSKQELDGMSSFQVIMETNEFEQWLSKGGESRQGRSSGD